MKLSTFSPHRIILIVIALIAFANNCVSQKLHSSSTTSQYSYIYKLTQKEAAHIYKKEILQIDDSYFHTLVDSFPTQTEYIKELPNGYYVKTWAQENKQMVELTTVKPFEVEIFNNNVSLLIKVYDAQGIIIPDAKARIKNTHLRFDKKTQSYINYKSNKRGLLEVTHNGFTAYFSLNRQYNNSFISRLNRRLLYGFPLKYVWQPVRFIVHIPLDGVKSITRHQPTGTIYSIKTFPRRTINNISNFYEKHFGYDRKSQMDFKGYMVFNKPKYLPGDTVKLKAFVLDYKKRPLKGVLDVKIYIDRKYKTIGKLTPYRPGAYTFEFALNDSLKLILDRSYSITLYDEKKNYIISSSFKYEDYELSKKTLNLRLSENQHYPNTPLHLFLRGADENNLNLQDARVELTVVPQNITNYLEPKIFIPNILLTKEITLLSKGETEIVIPDTIFPEVNMTYQIKAKLFTSDNQTITQTKEVHFCHSIKELKMELQNDSLSIDYQVNGESKPNKVKIYAEDHFSHQTFITECQLPCKIALNPYYASYRVQAKNIKKVLDISSAPSLVQCYSSRDHKKVNIQVNNPRNLPFTYYIYKRNKEKARGNTDSLNFTKHTSSKENYFLNIQYLWGGQKKEENYNIPFYDKKLTVTVNEPELVFPGQKTKIELEVTDAYGKPAPNVDITAYSFTNKFNYSAPTLPDLNTIQKSRKSFNSFTLHDATVNKHPGLQLNYEQWKLFAGIDSIEHYKFIYPQNNIYQYEYSTNDSVTQFAPFVMKKGAQIPIHVIYIDNRPVYFSWSTTVQPYSFLITGGEHTIRLRTAQNEYTISGQFFNTGKKMILSIDAETANSSVKIKTCTSELSTQEKNILYRYIFPFRKKSITPFTYLKNGENIQQLYSNKNNALAGPISGYQTFHKLGYYSLQFQHEPMFEYEFSRKLLKMRSKKRYEYPSKLLQYRKTGNIVDSVITEDNITHQWDLSKKSRPLRQRGRPYYSHIPNGHSGKLLIHYSQDTVTNGQIPINVILLRNNNFKFIQITDGGKRAFNNLSEGDYKLIFLYPNSLYHSADSIHIKPNGINYYEINTPKTLINDSSSTKLRNLVEELYFRQYGNDYSAPEEVIDIFQQPKYLHTHNNEMIEGYVYDSNGEPLPGVTVMEKGTTNGTLTNMDGYYSIKVFDLGAELLFNFIGMKSQTIPINFQTVHNVEMQDDECALEEVVCVGYGVVQKRELTGAVSSMRSINYDLSRKMGGVDVSSSPMEDIKIHIRGASSIKAEDQPLYIVNGSVFNGVLSEIKQEWIKDMKVLKGVDALALYGSKATNGVILITTTESAYKTIGFPKNKGANMTDSFINASMSTGGLRNNFSDDAFWKPQLATDKDGKVSFEVQFPDDITSWNTYYLAMSDKKESGQASGSLKSYKPLMGQLALPRFLIKSDSAIIIGKTLNYLPTPINIKRTFKTNNRIHFQEDSLCTDAIIDSLLLVGVNDTVAASYIVEKTGSDYFDGEERTIPVFEQGMEKTEGQFYALDKDTTLNISLSKHTNNGTLYAKANILEVIKDELKHIINYKYMCNEQLGSKLFAMLTEEQLLKFNNKEYTQKDKIEKLISKLLDNRKESGLWGWWKSSPENDYISTYVIERLLMAQQMGYKVNWNTQNISEKLIWDLENSKSYYNKAKLIKVLMQLGDAFDCKNYLDTLTVPKNLSLYQQLEVVELKQMCGLSYSLDFIKKYENTTMFGNIFYSIKCPYYSIWNNSTQLNLLIYRIIRNSIHPDMTKLRSMRNYFFENRKTGYWCNTYESARIIETILPDLLAENNTISQPKLVFEGDITKEVSVFPFEMPLTDEIKFTVSKSGTFPVYLTVYEKYWEQNPKSESTNFEINTRFSNDSESLELGKEVELIAIVNVKHMAEYVMINIPIPAGCSYASKPNYNFYYNEVHREYFKNETAIFCEKLNKGVYKFRIKLLPRYTGKYTLNPAKAELMYFPTFYGNNEIKKVEIKK